MPTRRPSLSAPTYGSLTGNINWSRGMNERLANPPSIVFAPPVMAESVVSTGGSSSSKTTPPVGGGAYTRRFLMQNESE